MGRLHREARPVGGMLKGTWKKEHKTFACIDAALTFLRKDYVYRRWDGDGIEKTWRSFLQNKMHRVLAVGDGRVYF